MAKASRNKRYSLRFSGDAVDCIIAPITMEKAEYWLKRDGEDLFRHLHGLDGDDHDQIGEAYQVGRIGDLPGAQFLEGCEIKNGVLEITDADGAEVASFSLEEDVFTDGFVDDVIQIDAETHLVGDGPTLFARTFYSGDVTYQPENGVESFDEAEWYVVVTDMGGEPFISELNFEGENVVPQGEGSFGVQEVRLLVPQPDGSVRQVHYSTRPNDH